MYDAIIMVQLGAVNFSLSLSIEKKFKTKYPSKAYIHAQTLLFFFNLHVLAFN